MTDSIREPWWVNHADHMAGWEAFGVSGSEPTVRRLGMVTFVKGKATTDMRLGTTKFGPGETLNGVAGVEFSTHADDPTGAFIHVLGTTERAVRARFLTVDAVFRGIAERLWSDR